MFHNDYLTYKALKLPLLLLRDCLNCFRQLLQRAFIHDALRIVRPNANMSRPLNPCRNCILTQLYAMAPITLSCHINVSWTVQTNVSFLFGSTFTEIFNLQARRFQICVSRSLLDRPLAVVGPSVFHKTPVISQTGPTVSSKAALTLQRLLHDDPSMARHCVKLAWHLGSSYLGPSHWLWDYALLPPDTAWYHHDEVHDRLLYRLVDYSNRRCSRSGSSSRSMFVAGAGEQRESSFVVAGEPRASSKRCIQQHFFCQRCCRGLGTRGQNRK